MDCICRLEVEKTLFIRFQWPIGCWLQKEQTKWLVQNIESKPAFIYFFKWLGPLPSPQKSHKWKAGERDSFFLFQTILQEQWYFLTIKVVHDFLWTDSSQNWTGDRVLLLISKSIGCLTPWKEKKYLRTREDSFVLEKDSDKCWRTWEWEIFTWFLASFSIKSLNFSNSNVRCSYVFSFVTGAFFPFAFWACSLSISISKWAPKSTKNAPNSPKGKNMMMGLFEERALSLHLAASSKDSGVMTTTSYFPRSVFSSIECSLKEIDIWGFISLKNGSMTSFL